MKKETKWYSLQEAMPIFKKELGINDPATIKKFILNEGSPKLKAVIYGINEGKRYRIKDEWITQFIADFEDC